MVLIYCGPPSKINPNGSGITIGEGHLFAVVVNPESKDIYFLDGMAAPPKKVEYYTSIMFQYVKVSS